MSSPCWLANFLTVQISQMDSIPCDRSICLAFIQPEGYRPVVGYLGIIDFALALCQLCKIFKGVCVILTSPLKSASRLYEEGFPELPSLKKVV